MTKSWFLVYMFCFTLFTMPPYMFTFKMLYDIAETRLDQNVRMTFCCFVLKCIAHDLR